MSGTGKPSALGHFAWESESSFAIASDDTLTTRHQINDARIDMSGLARPLVPAGGTVQLLNERYVDRLGAFGIGTFTVTIPLGGHGTATNGALTETNLSKLLAHAVGNTDWTQIGGNVTTQSSAVTDLQSTETTLVAGGLLRVGALGDARNEGQAYVVADNSSAYVMKTNLAVIAEVADDIFAMGLVYPVSSDGSGSIITADSSTSNNTIRCVLATANQIMVARGVVCSGLSLVGGSPGEMPELQFTFSAVAWNFISGTWPSAIASSDVVPIANATGSLMVQAKGTVTRATDVPLAFEVDLGIGVEPVVGQGGTTVGQQMVGWRRVPAETKVRITVESEAKTATPTWWTYHSTVDPTPKHLTYTANTTDGRSWAMYFPELQPVTSVPVQGSTNEINTFTAEFVAATDAGGADELLKAAWVLGLG